MLKELVRVKILFVGATILLSLFIGVSTSRGETSADGLQTPKWTVTLPARSDCPGGHSNCHGSSPVAADLTGDGIPDVVVATNNGHVIAVRSDGVQLWDTDLGPLFGMGANQQQIYASPAVADIDNDGQLEVVVATGAISQAYCTQGGVIVLKANNGQKEAGGWPFLTQDQFIPPSGCRDSIFSTPALGDLDKDGDMEIVVGSFDKRIYVLHHDGSKSPYFPIDSHHINLFPTWDGLIGHLADTIWGSASLVDMDGDSYLDIVQSTDEGNFDESFGGTGWDCPYVVPPHPWPRDYCGGALYAVDRFGNHLPGFPKRIHEVVSSSPAIYDIDADGLPEIFVGAGNFYYNTSPDHPTLNFRVYGWDNEGNDLPGWAGGKPTGASTPASPAIGNIAGDSTPEIIALGMDEKVYAWHADGSTVAGFPKKPINAFGQGHPFDVGTGPILGDYDGDGLMEIFVRVGWEVVILNGNGAILTNTNNANPNGPQFYTYGLLDNNPVLADIDNDNRLELLAHNSTLYAFELPTAGPDADWPMFRHNPARTGTVAQPTLSTSRSFFAAMHETGDASNITFNFGIRGTGTDPYNWTSVTPSGVTLSPSGSSLPGETNVTMTVQRAALTNGENNFSVAINAKIGGQNVVGSPLTLDVTVFLVNQVHRTNLPAVLR